MNRKLLLTSVFGPYGIENRWADGTGMQMELLNNQITRGQGIHSVRKSYYTCALYLLAENISIPTTVLDFPLWRDFTGELKRGSYTHVGINFIVPNVLKAKRMAKYIRKNYPQIKIILGGYGTIIPELEQIVPRDEVCRGEGIRWLQEYFSDTEKLTSPLQHPVIRNPVFMKLYGIKVDTREAILIPGLGCRNGCEFCVTSHNFFRQYIPLLKSGRDVFDACLRAYTQLEARHFLVLDENFLADKQRAAGFLKLMEEKKTVFSFDIFSTAEAIRQLGVDFLVRAGINAVWIGVESQTWQKHKKLKQTEIKSLVATLQQKGIVVVTSSILFLDHHDRKKITEDIDWTIGLGSVFTQFMNPIPCPTTPYYSRLAASGRLKSTGRLHWRHYHGAYEIPIVHPYLDNPRDHTEILKRAFKKKFLTQGAGMLNMAMTVIRGYRAACEDLARREQQGLAWDPEALTYIKTTESVVDEFFRLRVQKMKQDAVNIRYCLLTLRVFAGNRQIRCNAQAAIKLAAEILGRPGLQVQLSSLILLLAAFLEWIKYGWSRLLGRESVIYQPRKNRQEFNQFPAPGEKDTG